MDDFIWAHRRSDYCDCFCCRPFSSSRVCAGRSFPSVWGYLAGAILLATGIGLALNRKPRIAAASIGALMTVLTLFPYLLILILAHGSTPEFNDALNYVADTWLFAGAP
jgi:hypothetical protein